MSTSTYETTLTIFLGYTPCESTEIPVRVKYVYRPRIPEDKINKEEPAFADISSIVMKLPHQEVEIIHFFPTRSLEFLSDEILENSDD